MAPVLMAHLNHQPSSTLFNEENTLWKDYLWSNWIDTNRVFRSYMAGTRQELGLQTTSDGILYREETVENNFVEKLMNRGKELNWKPLYESLMGSIVYVLIFLPKYIRHCLLYINCKATPKIPERFKLNCIKTKNPLNSQYSTIHHLKIPYYYLFPIYRCWTIISKAFYLIKKNLLIYLFYMLNCWFNGSKKKNLNPQIVRTQLK